MLSRENLGPWASLAWVEAVKAESGNVSWTPRGTVQPTSGGLKSAGHRFGFRRSKFIEHCHENSTVSNYVTTTNNNNFNNNNNNNNNNKKTTVIVVSGNNSNVEAGTLRSRSGFP